MTDITKIMSVINKINAYCREIDALETTISTALTKERESISKQSNELISDMQYRYESFKSQHFERLRTAIKNLENLLAEDYADVRNKVDVNAEGYASLSYADCEKLLAKLMDLLNDDIAKLNALDFNKLVPEVHVEVNGESFITYTGNHENVKEYDHNAKTKTKITDPKPIAELAKAVFLHCKKLQLCLDTMESLYDKQFNIAGFNSYVRSNANTWMSEFEAKQQTSYSKRFDELFRDESASAIPKEFFTKLAEEGAASEVDMVTGSDTYNTSITIGNAKLLVEDQKKHLNYLSASPVLGKYLDNGRLVAPVILDLKKTGNVLIKINEDNYGDDVVGLVNQLIMQFLLSNPANRITFCLVDIDNKMGFSQFKSLTKINNGILFNGIIRDDRMLENTIKDMEQTMYKIDDDILSYNNVPDIYEYNSRFEANPQNIHLFVLVNYPTGMRDDLAKRVVKIMQNGNKAGIYTILINNAACPLPVGYKPTEHQAVLAAAEKTSVVITKSGGALSLNLGIKNTFEPKKEINVSALPEIIEMLKKSAESNKQKVVHLSQLFSETDKQEREGIPSSAEVLDIPIGVRGGEVQNILLKTTGDGSAHAVVIGGTGSGKSNLLHTIIMSSCYKYSPEELNLYLVDFKGGVEFKFYEANKNKAMQIPHIKLTGLTSDLEDGVAILSNLQKELRRREDEFRKSGVEDIVAYRKAGKKIPRLFVIIDEIQELFEQDERLGQKAIDILREIFKKGRAFGINILWASQNIPNAPGLKDKVLSQIGNRISLRLNEPDDAIDIKIDPKVVRNLNRPEKGLGVINDIRTGNESVEFRVAFAETSENRVAHAQTIIDKWKAVTTATKQEPLFIVGDDDEPSPVDGNTIYNVVPQASDVISRSYGSYHLQLGQDYVTGKPYDIDLKLREDKWNLLLAGYDVEILRDMMGYSLLSVAMSNMINADCVKEGTKIYYANGEMINPKNSEDLFNVIRSDFGGFVENVSSTEKMVNCVKDLYKLYKTRAMDSDTTEECAKTFTPAFVVIHSMQRYTDLFNENPVMRLSESESAAPVQAPVAGMSKLDEAMSLFSSAKSFGAASEPQQSFGKSKMPDSIHFADAFKDLLDKGGKFGLHFIISMDNPLGIPAIKSELSASMYKIFVKGIGANVINQLLGEYKSSGSLNNPKVALVAMQDERVKIRVYRYDQEHDSVWYKKLCENYRALGGK